EIEYRVDGTDWQPYTEPFELGAEGSHRVEARVRDALGRANRDELELHVDTSPPETTATVRELGSSVEVTFFATDSTSGVVRIRRDGPGTLSCPSREASEMAVRVPGRGLAHAAPDGARRTGCGGRPGRGGQTAISAQAREPGRAEGRCGRLAAPG